MVLPTALFMAWGDNRRGIQSTWKMVAIYYGGIYLMLILKIGTF